MSVRRSVFKGGAALSAGQVVGQALAFVRNIVIARWLSPEDVGIAAMFWLTMALLDMFSYLAAETLIIQAEDGENERLQRTAQGLQAVRGAVSAVLLFALAWPVSQLFGMPQALWAFQCLALVPLIRGFIHLDMMRVQRHMSFKESVTVEVGSQTVATLLAWPLAAWLGDYSAVLWMVMAQYAARVVGSHIVAQRRYGLAWDRAFLGRIVRFGWPLLINNFLMFAILQSDRLVVASTFTKSELGVYAMAFTLMMMPTFILAQISGTLLFPLLSKSKGSERQLRGRYALIVQALCAVAGLIGAGMIVGGGWLIEFLYGPNYAPAAAYIGWLAAMQAVRLIRVAPTLVTMAKADTKNSMFSNAVRASFLVLAVAAAVAGLPIAWIAAAGLLGEVAALAYSLWRLSVLHGMPLSLSLRPIALTGVGMAAAGLIAANLPVGSSVLAVGAAVLAGAVVGVAMLAAFAPLRQEAVTLVTAGLNHRRLLARPRS